MNPDQLTDEQVEKYVRDIAAQEAAKKAAELGQQQTTPEPQPFKMVIAGQEMTFNSPEEASNAVNAALAQATQQQVQPQEKPTTGIRVTDDEGTRQWTKEDQAKYVDLLTTNPVAASEYVDEFRFGVKNPTALIKQNLQTTHQIVQQNVIDRFVANNKDYVPTPENAAAMEQVLKELGGGRVPQLTDAALEAAHALAERRGLLKKPEQQQQRTNREDNPYLRTPPAAGRTAANFSANPSFDEQVENMTADQIEVLFNRMGR